MTKAKAEYKVITSSNVDELEMIVHGAMAHGWMPVGGIATTPLYKGDGYTEVQFWQAMTRITEQSQDD